MSTTRCTCARGYYDAETYNSCYDCYLERRSEFWTCIWCGKWHNPKFATCYTCRQSSPKRDEAGRDLRLVILGRDIFTCRICGDTEGFLQIDHIKPCAQGGTADPWNLQTLCDSCNHIKGSTWWSGCPYEQARHELVHAYSTYLWQYLSKDEQERLHVEVTDWLDIGQPDESPPARRLTADERDWLRRLDLWPPDCSRDHLPVSRR